MKLKKQFKSTNMEKTKVEIGGEAKMKTLEVGETYLAEVRLSYHTKDWVKKAFGLLSEYTPDWPDDLQVAKKWVVQLGGMSPNTIRTLVLYVKTVSKYMYDNYDIPNVFEKVKAPPKDDKPRRILNADQMMAVMECCQFGYDRELILTLIDSTARIGDIGYDPKDPERHPGLKGRDVDLENGQISTKGKTGWRRYRLDKRVCLALKNLAGGDDSWVFKDRFDGPATFQALKQRVTRVMLRAGLTGEKLGPHILRHSDATLIARDTQSALAVKSLLKHDDINTSMIYIHDVEDEIAQDISPLQLVAKYSKNGGNGMKIEPRQIGMSEGEGIGAELALVEQPEIVDGLPDYTSDLFPEVLDGVSVRPLLKTDDLRLLRRIFVEFARQDGNHGDMIRARELMKRMTRRTR